MTESMRQQLDTWPKPYIPSYALKRLVQKDEAAYYSFVQRAVKKGQLVRVRNGLYQIGGRPVSRFELAHQLHSPSFISLESALSHHGWIPEAVYTTTSCCVRRTVEISTPVGLFSYTAVPLDQFYMGVSRVSNDDTFLIATPWRALADLIYTQKRRWRRIRGLMDDLRIEPDELFSSDLSALQELACSYPCGRVRKMLSSFNVELQG